MDDLKEKESKNRLRRKKEKSRFGVVDKVRKGSKKGERRMRRERKMQRREKRKKMRETI